MRHLGVGDVAEVLADTSLTNGAVPIHQGPELRRRRQQLRQRCEVGRTRTRRHRRGLSVKLLHSGGDTPVAGRRPRIRPDDCATFLAFAADAWQQAPPAGRRPHDAMDRRDRSSAPAPCSARPGRLDIGRPGIPFVGRACRPEARPILHRVGGSIEHLVQVRRSAVPNLLRTWSTAFREGSPMPTRSRAKSWLPSSPMIERRPLCVPALPRSRSLSLPSGKSKSSITTRGR